MYMKCIWLQCALIVVILSCFPLLAFGQNYTQGLDVLNNVKEKIHNDSFEEAINIIDKCLTSETSISDSIRAELYYNKSQAEYNLGRKKSNYSKGKQSLYKAIEIYESLNNKDKERLSKLYRRNLNYIKPSFLDEHNINDYKQTVIKLFNNGHYYASDNEHIFNIYAYYCNHKDVLILQHQIDSLTESLKNQIKIPQYFSTYLKCITASLISRDYVRAGGAYYFAHFKSLRKAFPIYCECLKEYESYKRNIQDKSEPLEYLEACCLSGIVDICDELQMYDIAAIYQKKKLELIYRWWKHWGVKSPWHNHKYIGNHALYSYEKYMYFLESSKQYAEGIKYSEKVLRDIVNYEIDGAAEYLQSYIDRLIELNAGEERGNLLGSGMKNEELSNLYHSNSFDLLKQTANKIHNDAIYHWNGNAPIPNNYIADFFGDESIKSTREEDILFAKREMWWFANGYSDYWEALCYMAIIEAHHGNIQQAIKYQEEVVDIVKVDYKFQPNLRNKLLESHSYTELSYINTEIQQYLYLAEYYFKYKRNNDAIRCLRIALNSTKDILSVSMFGSDSAKYDFWHNAYITLNSLLSIAISYNNESQEIADIILEIFPIMKGVLQNNKITTQLAILNYSGSLKDKSILNSEYKTKLELDRKIDLTYYTNQEARREELLLERANHQICIDGYLDGRQIAESSYFDINKIKKNLCKGDLYLDFMTFANSGDTTMYVFVDSLRHNHYVAKSIPKLSYFVVAYKPEWEHARLIEAFDNISKIGGDNLGALTQYEGTNSQNIYKFYTSPVATNYVWSKILKVSDLSEGANIYFVPTGELTGIAIEHMLMEDGTRVCDKYNCYRITSANEIERKSIPHTSSDNAAIFCNMNYNWTNSSQMLPSLRENLTNPHFEETKNSMQEMFGLNLVQYMGNSSTENNITALSGNSPAYLHMATHGFNKLWDELKNDEKEYLIGHRKEYYSNIDESMYRTGLYMSSSYWDRNTANDGLLTSHEISLLDLSNTKLCVLSACSTASGRKSSEGVFGLPRAFKLAGVKTIMVSLWDVDDKATELLMDNFYKYLKLGFSPLISLTKSQLDVRNHIDENDYLKGLDNVHRYENPFYWAGFILLDAN